MPALRALFLNVPQQIQILYLCFKNARSAGIFFGCTAKNPDLSILIYPVFRPSDLLLTNPSKTRIHLRLQADAPG